MQFLRVCFQNAASATEVSRRNYQFYRPPEVAVRPKHPKLKKNENRKTNSFFVFLTSLLKTKNEKRKTKNEKRIRFSFFFTSENEKRKRNWFLVSRSQIL